MGAHNDRLVDTKQEKKRKKKEEEERMRMMRKCAMNKIMKFYMQF